VLVANREFAPNTAPMPLEMAVVAEAEEMEQNAAGGGFGQSIDTFRQRLPPGLVLPTLRVQPAAAARLLILLMCSHSHFSNERL
jgi:hypothetical protein